MKRKEWEQLVCNKKNDSVVKVTTIKEEYKDGDKTICMRISILIRAIISTESYTFETS